MNPLASLGRWMFAVVGGIGIGAGAIALSQPGEPAVEAVPAAPSPQDLSMAFRYVAERSLPAIVAIDTVGAAGTGAQGPHDEDFFRRFFEENPGIAPEIPEDFNFEDLPPEQGNGSGFIVDASGIVLTNSHVVEGAETVIVRLFDGREYNATSWDYDPRADVAVIRIEADGELPTIPMGDSSRMQIGDWVLAMGNPFNVGTTVTAGIISAIGRGPGINEREDYLQTDAAINPGNSGGPLVNMNGEVVGINTAISTQSGGYDGVGFSIPINMAHWAAQQLIEHGYVRRSYLGVALQELDGSLRGAFGVPLGEGALVGQVFDNTPAQNAGLEAGDVIVSIDDVVITSRSHLQETIERIEPGSSVSCGILRDGSSMELEIVLEEMPSDFTPAMQRRRTPETETEEDDPETTEEGASHRELGFDVSDLTAEVVSQYEIPEELTGVVITTVEPDSPAGSAGLTAGDVIDRVGSQDVSSIEEFNAAVADAMPGKGILMRVHRGESSRFVILKPEES